MLVVCIVFESYDCCEEIERGEVVGGVRDVRGGD